MQKISTQRYAIMEEMIARDPDEKELVNRAVKGDKKAFGKLYEKHLTKIYRFLYVKLRNRFEAEDLTETVFIKAWTRISKYKEKGRPFHAYLYQIARTTLVDFFRRKKGRVQGQSLAKTPDVSHSPDFTSPIARVEERERIEEALARFPSGQGEVLTLLFIEEYDIREAARILGKSQGAIRVLKHRGIKRLKKLLQNKGTENGKRRGKR